MGSGRLANSSLIKQPLRSRLPKSDTRANLPLASKRPFSLVFSQLLCEPGEEVSEAGRIRENET